MFNVVATHTNKQSVAINSQVIKLLVSSSPVLGVNFAPEFVEPLQNMKFMAGDAFNYTLPAVDDEEGD